MWNRWAADPVRGTGRRALGTAGVGANHSLMRVALQPVQEEPDVLDVVPALDRRGGTHIDGVRQLVERPVDTVHRVDVAQVRPARLEAQVVEVLGPAEQFEELDGVGVPPGDVPGQLLQHRHGALAAPVVDRLGDVDPGLGSGVVQQVVGDQVTEVGHDPCLAGLDEEVVPEPVDVLAQDLGLLADHPQQRLQRPALLGVLEPVQRREQLVEPVGGDRRHDSSPPLTVTSASAGSSSDASSAGETFPELSGRAPTIRARIATVVNHAPWVIRSVNRL